MEKAIYASLTALKCSSMVMPGLGLDQMLSVMNLEVHKTTLDNIFQCPR